MTNKNIYMNLGGLDPELIMKAAPAEKMQKKKSRTWVKWASLAACLCLVITASIVILPSILDDIFSGEDIGESVALREALNKFVWSLPDKTQNVFVRRYWYSSSISEIAKEYGIKESSVTVLLLRTRKKLKAFLQKEGFDV